MKIRPQKTKSPVTIKMSLIDRDFMATGSKIISELGKDLYLSQSDFLSNLILIAFDSDKPAYIIDGVPYTIREIFIQGFEKDLPKIKEIALEMQKDNPSLFVTFIINEALKKSGYTSGDEYVLGIDYRCGTKYYDELCSFLINEQKKSL